MYSVIGTDGKVYGPVHLQTIQAWASEGRVQPHTNLIDPISGRVLPATDVPELRALFQAAQAPPNQPTPNPTGHVQINQYFGPAPAAHGAIVPAGKSKLVAILLVLFLGALGIHRFYLGHNGTGLAMLLITVCTCFYGVIITWIWALVDLIMIATGSLGDASGASLS